MAIIKARNKVECMTVDCLKDIKLKEVRKIYADDYNNYLKDNFSELEVSTFGTQEAEWNAWNLDNNTQTVRVDAMAVARNVDRLILLKKIGIAVLEKFTTVGLQQAKEDEINTCTTEDELNAITI